jgi:hypothetical protein
MNKEYKTSEAQRKAVRKWAEEHKERKKELDKLHNIRRRERIKKEHQELMKLQNNWNELKNYLEKQIIDSKSASSQQYYFNTIYKLMQELEQGSDE